MKHMGKLGISHRYLEFYTWVIACGFASFWHRFGGSSLGVMNTYGIKKETICTHPF